MCGSRFSFFPGKTGGSPLASATELFLICSKTAFFPEKCVIPVSVYKLLALHFTTEVLAFAYCFRRDCPGRKFLCARIAITDLGKAGQLLFRQEDICRHKFAKCVAFSEKGLPVT